MASKYPGTLDVFVNPSATQALNATSAPHADQHANANDAIRAIESTLGINPQGSQPTVAERLTAIEARLTSAGF